MQLMDLPLDVFRLIAKHIVNELGLEDSMRARLTCSMVHSLHLHTRYLFDKYHRNIMRRDI